MTVVLIALVVALAVALATITVIHFRAPARRSATVSATRARRILFPFMANALSSRALDAALRLSSAEEATLVPVFLAQVPLNVPLETPLPRQCAIALPLQEAIEQRATRAGVPVDSRIETGRDYRHALRRSIASERYDRIVVAAAANGGPGFSAADVAWLLEHARGEIVILRAASDEPLTPESLLGARVKHPAINREYETAALR
ncbi:MAG TPA: universal stress protein [Solirubrobacteraceae bacterium]